MNFRSFATGLFILINLSIVAPAFAGPWSLETEIGGAEHSATFQSQYVFYNSKNWNALGRYFNVESTLERGEFAAGPTFHVGPVEFQIQIGVTTLDQVMTALTVITPIMGHTVVYIGDAKTSWRGEPDTFYQKVWVALDKKGAWQLRLEDLLFDGVNAYTRLGVEYRLSLLEGKVALFAAPFYDPENNEFGGQGGIRLLGL